MTRRLRPTDDRGSVTLEAAIIAPGLLLVLVAAIAAGRVNITGGAVEEAARAAARTASIARDPTTAQREATAAARATLAEQDLDCTSLSIRLDTTGFTVPVGQPASVTATVTCTVGLDDLAVPAMPGHKTLTARFTSPLDQFRERGQ